MAHMQQRSCESAQTPQAAMYSTVSQASVVPTCTHSNASAGKLVLAYLERSQVNRIHMPSPLLHLSFPSLPPPSLPSHSLPCQ